MGIDDALRSAFGDARYERRFFGNRNGLEATIVTTMPLVFVPSAPLQRRFSLGALRTLARNLAGVGVALYALARYRPALLVATGGYVCFPVVLAARLLRLLRVLDVRIGLLEINARPGLTNRLLGPLVDEVWLTYAQSSRFFGRRGVLTGAPVRASLERLETPDRAREKLGLRPARTTIVVMGGSQGARSINDAVAELVTTRPLPAGWQLLLISGERDFALLRARLAAAPDAAAVRLVPYLADPADAYAAADIVVARAGASTLAELAITATPAMLVPYPFAADDHQGANAALFAAGGAAVVVPDAELNAGSLLATLSKCLDSGQLADMKVAARALTPGGAATRIVERITALLAPRVIDPVSPNEVARD